MAITFSTALDVLGGNFEVTEQTKNGCVLDVAGEKVALTNTQACEAAVALKDLTKMLSGKVAGTDRFAPTADGFKNRVPDAIAHTALALEKISERLGCSFLWECAHSGIEFIAKNTREAIDAATVKRG